MRLANRVKLGTHYPCLRAVNTGVQKWHRCLRAVLTVVCAELKTCGSKMQANVVSAPCNGRRSHCDDYCGSLWCNLCIHKTLTRGRTGHFSNIFLYRDRELWPVTLTFELDLNCVEMNRRAEYLAQRSFIVQKLSHGQTHVHTPERWLYLDH